MKKILILPALACLLFTFGCTKPEIKPPQKISPREVVGLLANDFAVLIDVREAQDRDEFIAKSVSVPSSKLETEPGWNDFVKSLRKDKQVVIHCYKGATAKEVAERLAPLGYKVSYFSGVDEWKAEGLPVQKGR